MWWGSMQGRAWGHVAVAWGREGSAGRGTDGAGEQREAAQGLCIAVMHRFWRVMVEEHARHRGSVAVVWGREGSIGERWQQEVAGGQTAGAGGWWEGRQQVQGEHVVVGEHTGQGTGACGSGMGQRERGQRRQGGREGWGQREAAQQAGSALQ